MSVVRAEIHADDSGAKPRKINGEDCRCLCSLVWYTQVQRSKLVFAESCQGYVETFLRCTSVHGSPSILESVVLVEGSPPLAGTRRAGVQGEAVHGRRAGEAMVHMIVLKWQLVNNALHNSGTGVVTPTRIDTSPLGTRRISPLAVESRAARRRGPRRARSRRGVASVRSYRGR